MGRGGAGSQVGVRVNKKRAAPAALAKATGLIDQKMDYQEKENGNEASGDSGLACFAKSFFNQTLFGCRVNN